VALASSPSEYRGAGVNHEGERFVGTLRIQSLLGGAAVLLHYDATLASNEIAHAECTLLASDMAGTLTLWPVMSELPGVLPHRAVVQSEAAATFSSGGRDNRGSFREEVTIAVAKDGSLTYAHAWGLHEGDFEERSSCTLRPR
jgi:hypothetical protein